MLAAPSSGAERPPGVQRQQGAQTKTQASLLGRSTPKLALNARMQPESQY
ncbi:uncharacterized protein DS421_13g411500 [Arachis hypogaea]|nr:uncharacterized protein DS421_13g411500 [Arachis hypogaea]